MSKTEKKEKQRTESFNDCNRIQCEVKAIRSAINVSTLGICIQLKEDHENKACQNNFGFQFASFKGSQSNVWLVAESYSHTRNISHVRTSSAVSSSFGSQIQLCQCHCCVIMTWSLKFYAISFFTIVFIAMGGERGIVMANSSVGPSVQCQICE